MPEITLYDRMNVRGLFGGCYAFAWVGQPFYSCDRCGLPYWEHSHEEVHEGRRLRKLIPADRAAKVRKVWKPVMDQERLFAFIGQEPTA